MSATSKIADPQGKALGVAITDIDNDGWPDIVVANDSVRQSLYHNRGDGTFEDIALPAGMGYDENGKTFAGMGVDAADYDEDGYPDVFITALSYQTYSLFHNSGDKTFTYDTNLTGVGPATQVYSGWGTRFVDVDNDGLQTTTPAAQEYRQGIHHGLAECGSGVRDAACGAWRGSRRFEQRRAA
ncbi:MAG: hypothetical protein DME57_06735 [Verrucomicrobia bacterium]|nr:MAG: hypothetical protein DME57_06735 [Verrucomicrobiota bacterium]